jgi:hypothetical protein
VIDVTAEIEFQTTERREIEMVEQTQTNNQTQTKDNKITKARNRVTTNTPAQISRIRQNPECPSANEKDNKSDYTINFTRRALTFLGQHASLAEPEAAGLFVARAYCERTN